MPQTLVNYITTFSGVIKNNAIDFATSSAGNLVSIEFKCGFPLLHMYDNQAIEWTIMFTIQGSPGIYNE